MQGGFSFMSKNLTLLICTLTFCFLQMIVAGTSHAIPAFSRANKVECTTCHTIYPELNEYGEAFLKNSYVYVGKPKKGAKAAPAAAAAPAPAAAKEPAAASATPTIKGEGDAAKLSKMKAGAMGGSTEAAPAAPAAAAAAPAEQADGQSEGMLLAGIPELLPISFTGSINYSAGDRKSMIPGYNEIDFSARSLSLLAGGNFREKIGFYTNYTLYSEGQLSKVDNTSKTVPNNNPDLKEMFVQWRNALGTPVNLKIGRMQPKLGLWKTSNKLTVTNKYLPYSYVVPFSEFSIDQPQDAIELNAILGSRFFAAGGIVNHKGQNQKDGYGHLSYKFGGADYLGNEPNVDLDKEEQILDFLVLTVGGYGYFGQNGTFNNSQARNTFQRYGVDTEMQYKIFKLRMLGGFGQDGNVYDNLPNTPPWTTVISKTGTVEGEFTLLTNLIAAGRFEYLQQTSALRTYNNPIVRRYVATVGFAPIENFKLTAEFKYDIGTNVNNALTNRIESQVISRIGTLSAMFAF
jgi:hypothetical protein